MATNSDLIKYEIIKSLHKIVKLANNETLALYDTDIGEGVADGDDIENYFEEITKNFKSWFQLYAGLACEAMRHGGDGLYINGCVYNGDDYYKQFED